MPDSAGTAVFATATGGIDAVYAGRLAPATTNSFSLLQILPR